MEELIPLRLTEVIHHLNGHDISSLFLTSKVLNRKINKLPWLSITAKKHDEILCYSLREHNALYMKNTSSEIEAYFTIGKRYSMFSIIHGIFYILLDNRKIYLTKLGFSSRETQSISSYPQWDQLNSNNEYHHFFDVSNTNIPAFLYLVSNKVDFIIFDGDSDISQCSQTNNIYSKKFMLDIMLKTFRSTIIDKLTSIFDRSNEILQILLCTNTIIILYGNNEIDIWEGNNLIKTIKFSERIIWISREFHFLFIIDVDGNLKQFTQRGDFFGEVVISRKRNRERKPYRCIKMMGDFILMSDGNLMRVSYSEDNKAYFSNKNIKFNDIIDFNILKNYWLVLLQKPNKIIIEKYSRETIELLLPQGRKFLL